MNQKQETINYRKTQLANVFLSSGEELGCAIQIVANGTDKKTKFLNITRDELLMINYLLCNTKITQ